MSSGKIDPAVERMLADRYLLTSGLTEFPQGVILVTCGDATGGSPAEVRLTLTAPGLDEHFATLDSLREDLVAWLRLSLTRKGLDALETFEAIGGVKLPGGLAHALSTLVNTNWAYNVTIRPHFQTKEPEIVVSIDDCNVLGHRSQRLVLAAAKLYLTPIARGCYQQVITLAGGQRYMPLEFEVDDLYRRSMKLILHPSLEFVRPRMLAIRRDGEENFLQVALEMALDRFEFVVRVGVRTLTEGVQINVNFDGRHMPTAPDLNAVQAAMTDVLRTHVYLKSGFFTDLVLAPAYTHSDPEGDYDEGAGWLGEFQEY
jgi:hypothetical protein